MNEHSPDTASGSRTDRTGLEEALNFARPGDTLVVWRLDRLGRSLRHLIDTISLLQERGIGFKSLPVSAYRLMCCRRYKVICR